MSKRFRLGGWKALVAGLSVLSVLAAASLYGLLYTAWFQKLIQREVIAQVELLTGGRATIGDLYLEPSTLRLQIDELTIRAADGAGPFIAEPFIEIPRLELDLTLDSFLGREVSLASVMLDSPVVRIFVGPNGETNLPALPERPSGANAVPRELFELAVGSVDIRNGTFRWNDEEIPLSFSSSDMELRTRFQPEEESYRAWLRVGASELNLQGRRPVLSEAEMEVLLYQDRVVVPEIYWASGGAKVVGDLQIDSLREPSVLFRYQAEVALPLWASWLGTAPLTAGVAKTNGEARWDEATGEMRYTGQLTVDNLRPESADFPLEALSASGRYEGDLDRLRLNDLRAEALGGVLTGEGQVSGLATAAPRFDFTMNLEGFPLEPLIAAVPDLPGPVREAPWVTVVSGALTLEGHNQDDLHVAADLRLDHPGVTPAGRIPLRGALNLAYEGDSGSFRVTNSEVATPSSRVSLDGLLRGGGEAAFTVLARVDRLDDFRLWLEQPGSDAEAAKLELRGEAEIGGEISGDLAGDGLSFDGELSVKDFSLRGRRWDLFRGDVRLTPTRLQISNATIEGEIGSATLALAADLEWPGEEMAVVVSAIEGDIALKDVQLGGLLALAGYDQPVAGLLNGGVRFGGPLEKPNGSAQLVLTEGVAWEEQLDRVQVEMHLAGDEFVLDSFEVVRQQARLEGQGSVDRASGEFRLEAKGDGWDLKDIERFSEAERPPTGLLTFELEGRGRLPTGKDLFDEISLSGSFGLQEVKLGERDIGSFSGTLTTQGRRVDVGWQGNLLSGEIAGHAEFRPDDEGPFSGACTVKGLDLVHLAGLADLNVQQTKGSLDAQFKFSGVATDASRFTVDGEITRIQLNYSQIPGAERGYELWNPFPLRWGLADETLDIDGMQFLGDGTDIRVDGTIGLYDGFAQQEDSIDLTIVGVFNLAVLESFRPGLAARGKSELNVNIGGSADQPTVRGRMGIKDGTLRHSSFSNGLSELNGRIRFNENTIQIEEVSAESGGGNLRLGGTVVREVDRWDYRLRADIESVRVRYPESLSSVVDGQLTYSGTDLRSLLAGEVVVSRVSIGSDLLIGDVIASLAEPTQTPASSAVLVNMGLSVRIASVPDLLIETPLIRNVAANMDLQLGGTAVSPSLRGDMKITQGEVLFQGSNYTINRGDINFYNPFRIEPVVNIELETRIRDIDIALTISGPASLPNLSYRSDPPLRWDELFNLIALARSPTTDPVLATQQTIQQQSMIQGGGNAVLYRALSSPTTGGSGRGSQRLQRFFGVSRLKVDPRTGGAELNPGARISTEQQITRDLTLLYSYDLSEAQQQVVRVEWTPVRQWSFVVTRDENGLVGADIIFKKRLR